jgi:hypothetical protein
MAGTVPQITAGSINGVTGLSERPVYFLKVNGSPTPNLVVKGDAASGAHAGMTDDDAAVSIKWGSKLMKNVNNELVNTKIMTPPEVAVFKQAAMMAFSSASKQYLNVAPGGPAYCWVKMPMVPGLSDAEYYKKNVSGPGDRVVPADIKLNIQKFSDDQVWTDLGKVVAVDIFNGNGDRFDINSGRWVNKGNVMFLAGGQTRVVGLDTFDPNGGMQSNLNTGGGFEELRTLIDVAQRNRFALACTKSVGSEMKRALLTAKGMGTTSISIVAQGPGGPVVTKIELATMENLFIEYAPFLAAGIATGADTLKAYLQGKVRQYAPSVAPPSPWARRGVSANVVLANAHVRGVPQNIQMPGLPPMPGQAPPRPGGPPPVPGKTIPPGVLARMAYLGW